ncbi:hypothetical protein N836_05530 [Leptolyngbya sp. Heron Island J]|uniref:tetratricopeptide repeat protein n=1 Tax=Leptolyngbya sp. Heron Island J TaxID=1385935 RepID=UPI0003B9526C|nr:tetratricopeptide repeat protein [Leptolyngbya sp. Heron Island J]ESA37024.1 hypothetical protein N836_05530 [Leptolyngbya sp. Heron Island J]
MLPLFWKSIFSSSVVSATLFCLGSAALAQPVELNRARQLADIAFGYGLANRADKAMPLLEQAATYEGGDCFEATAWLKIGVGYQAVNQPDKAEEFFTRAVEIARERTLENCASSATSPEESLLNRANNYAEAGHLDLALTIANRVEHLFQPITMVKIAGEFYDAGQQAEAEQLVTQAIETAQQSPTEPMVNRMILLIAMVDQLIQLEQPELAQLVVETSQLQQPETFEVTNSFESALYHFQVLRLARLLVDLDQPPLALSLLDGVVPNIQPLAEFPSDVVNNWIDAAVLYNTLGSDQAEMLWATVNNHVQQITDPQELASAQHSLVRGYTEMGDFEQAKTQAQAIEKTSTRQAAHETIASAYARAGQVEAANSLVQSMGNPQSVWISLVRAYLETEKYDQAEELARQLVPQPDMSNAISTVGRTYCNDGLPERVVPLIDLSPSADGLRSCAAIAFAEQGEIDKALQLTQAITAPESQASTLVAIAAQCTTDQVAWQRLIGWLPKSVKTWLGVCDSAKAVELLDQALELI